MNRSLEYYHGEDELLIYVTGEIDHHSCEGLRLAADELINRFTPEKTTLDFRDVTFCDSSGIAFILGRYKLVTALGKSISVINVPPQPYKIFTLAAVNKIVSLSPLKIPSRK